MRSLSRQLDAFFTALLERTDATTAAQLRRLHETLGSELLARDVRTTGDLAPAFTLPDQDGRPVSLAGLLELGPVVLTFFRGGWCPFCSITLRALQAVSGGISRAGARLVAIGPQGTEEMAAVAETQGLGFPLLSDRGNAVARRYGLMWQLDAETQALYRRLGHDVPACNGAPGWELPMPAGYVISPEGRIRHARVDPRTTHRLEPAEILSSLKALQSELVG